MQGGKGSVHYDLFVLGEALIDLVQQADGLFLPLSGCSPYNLCYAAALQGVKAGYLNPFSTDPFGQTLRAQLEKAGAHPLSTVTLRPTSLSLVTLVNGQPHYGFYREGIADLDYREDDIINLLNCHSPGVFHTGSLMAMPPQHERLLPILAAAKKRGWIISVDVNVRSHMAADIDAYLRAIQSIALYADWLKASDEDLRFLGFGTIDAANVAACAGVFRRQACSRIALTFGEKGAYLQVSDFGLFAPAPKIDVIDTIGAGDVFWATCLAEWICHSDTTQEMQEVERVLQRALQAAALNCTRAGCSPPQRYEL